MATRLVLAAACLLAVGACVRSQETMSNNLTWLVVESYVVTNRPPAALAAVTQDALYMSSVLFPGYQRIRLNLGLLEALHGSEAKALADWQAAPQYQDRLVWLGQTREARGRWDEALLFYRGTASDQPDRPGWYQLAGICQRTIAHPKHLNQQNQRLCNMIWAQYENNLLLNSDFSAALPNGWFDHTRSSTIITTTGVPAPARSSRG